MSPKSTISLENAVLKAVFCIDDQSRAPLDGIIALPNPVARQTSQWFDNSSLPVFESRLNGQGNDRVHDKTGKCLVGSIGGRHFRYRSHDLKRKGACQTLDIEMWDETTKIVVISHWTLYDDLPVLRSYSTIRNDSAEATNISQLTSMVFGGLVSGSQWWNDYELSIPNNTWFREAQWQTVSLPSVGLSDYGVYQLTTNRHLGSMHVFSLSNRSTFSTQGHLPMGMLQRKDHSATWLWQIENNGAWRWELGDYKDSLYLATSGAEAQDHEWRFKLEPGCQYDTPPTALVHVAGDQDATFAALTRYRRQLIRKHDDHKTLPIIFNDYMNCLMGDPTEEKLLALLDPVAASGAEYFVIDAGWYAEDSNWWDDVGAWEPSNWRFPRGFAWLIEEIQRKGLKTGVWIEPEVIGVRSKLANHFPADAFFQRDGVRTVEKGRYQLDYRHPAVIKRMDGVIDRLVNTYGIKYFKFDYNIEIVLGTDVNASSAGVGQEGHSRAYLAWVSRLLDRHPGLVIENCSSGAQRMEYAMLSIHTLQSTSDQQDPILYAAIAAALPTAVLPEQGATWAYPQPSWSDEINALTVVNSLLGRIHLSGRLDIMSQRQLELVYDGMKAYCVLRQKLNSSTPFWPLGLPTWQDEWLALGMTAGSECWISVWRRGGSKTIRLPIGPFRGIVGVQAEVYYPRTLPAEIAWSDSDHSLELTLPETVCARLCRLTVS
ncbi:hypothetical protein JCM24511_02495 [Saitozyma sp. JCM 24511]|nr:hypothetical protein JCM24511_02495 [Saitozyma sp. JCM 24511]